MRQTSNSAAGGILAALRSRAKQQPKRILLPETSDARVVEAALRLTEQGLCTPVFLHRPDERAGNIECFADMAERTAWLDKAVDAYAHRRGIAVSEARGALEDPLLLAAVLVNLGYADGGIAGSLETTAAVLRAGIRGIGLTEGCDLVSSTFLMEKGADAYIFGDCAVNPYPDANQLAQIAIDSADTYSKLVGGVPKVAMLSFSTMGSAKHPMVEKVQLALQAVKAKRPELDVDGELQFDAAFVPSVGEKKAPESSVAGQANVFVFPDLNAANIGYKIAERMGGATAVGPILQGLAKPWLDLSRGCKAEDIVDAAVITALQVSSSEQDNG